MGREEHDSERCLLTQSMEENTMVFENKVAVVTGGAQGIGKAIAAAFEAEGATVYIIDIQKGNING